MRKKSCPKIIAFIPARKGSKSTPLKNIKSFAGKPLIYWVLLAAQLAKTIDEIYVSTDSSLIRKIVVSFDFSKVKVIKRSPATATDIASTESAMLEFTRKFDFDIIVLIQATAPLLTPADLDRAIRQYLKSKCDSMLSVVRQNRFVWNYVKKMRAVSVNYDYKKRPRRQNFVGYFAENGAFYITRREQLLKMKNRISGKIQLYEMPTYTYHELDEEWDWIMLESLADNIKSFYLSWWVSPVRIVVLDMDGVLTDGTVYYSKSKEKLLKFSRLDGKGMELLRKKRIEIWVLSSEDSAIAKRRCQKLGIGNYFGGVKDKLAFFKKKTSGRKIKSREVCFIGDDVQDISFIKWAGFSAAPHNAVEEVKTTVNYICSRCGGAGAVREVIDLILKLKGEKDGKRDKNRG